MMRLLAVALLAASPALAGDPAAGEVAFRICGACHRVGPDARNVVGPQLNGLIGRKAGTAEGFSYSIAMKSSPIVWDEALLLTYLRSPREAIPGTKMTFAGVKDEAKASDIVAYLATFRADGTRIEP